MKEKILKVYKSKYFMFIVLFLLILIIQLPISFSSDDVWFSKQLNNNSLLDFLSFRYHNWTSRIIIETFLVIITRIDVIVLKALNALLFTVSIFIIIKLIKDKKDKKIVWLLGLLFLLYPFTNMTEAGFAATTLNYLWPFSLGVISFLPLINKEKKIKSNMLIYIISSLSLLYAINQEQMCAIIFMFNLLYLLYKIYKKEKIDKYNIFCLLLASIGLIFILTCPGNSIRTLEETKTWYKDFTNFGLIEKFYLGLVPTIGVLLQNKVILGLTFIILSFASYMYSKKNFTKYIAVFNIILTILLMIFRTSFLELFPSFVKILDIFNYQQAPDFSNIKIFIAVPIAILVIVDLIYMILVIFKEKSLLPLLIFLAGFASRFIIGFSPTIFASGARTAFILYMSLIIVILYTLNKLYKDNKLSSKNTIILNGSIVIIVMLTYFDNLISML